MSEVEDWIAPQTSPVVDTRDIYWELYNAGEKRLKQKEGKQISQERTKAMNEQADEQLEQENMLITIDDTLSQEQYIGFCTGNALMCLMKAGKTANKEDYEEADFWLSQVITKLRTKVCKLEE